MGEAQSTGAGAPPRQSPAHDRAALLPTEHNSPTCSLTHVPPTEQTGMRRLKTGCAAWQLGATLCLEPHHGSASAGTRRLWRSRSSQLDAPHTFTAAGLAGRTRNRKQRRHKEAAH